MLLSNYSNVNEKLLKKNGEKTSLLIKWFVANLVISNELGYKVTLLKHEIIGSLFWADFHSIYVSLADVTLWSRYKMIYMVHIKFLSSDKFWCWHFS